MFSAQTKEQKMSRTLFLVCWIVYAIVCMTKIGYSASMVSIIGEGFLTKSLAGTVNASYYVFYGGAQLLLVKLVDKISPVKLINMALFGALISMVGFAVADNSRHACSMRRSLTYAANGFPTIAVNRR